MLPRGPQAGRPCWSPNSLRPPQACVERWPLSLPVDGGEGRGSSERSPQQAAPDGGDAGVCPGPPAPTCAGDGPAKGLPAKASSDPGLNGANLARPLHFHSVRRSRCHQSRRSQSSAGRRGGSTCLQSLPPDGKDVAFNLTEPDEVRGNWAVGTRNTCDRKTGSPDTHPASQALGLISARGHVRRRGSPQGSPVAALRLQPALWSLDLVPSPGKCHFLLMGTWHMQKCQLAR